MHSFFSRGGKVDDFSSALYFYDSVPLMMLPNVEFFASTIIMSNNGIQAGLVEKSPKSI